MSLDSRLRSGLRGAAEDVRPDVDARLRGAIHTGRRRRRLRQAGGVAALIAVVAVAVVSVPALFRAIERPRPAASPGVSSPADAPIPAELVGVYRRLIPASAAQGLPALAGTYELTLGADGILTLRTSRAFDQAYGDAEGQRYRIEGDLIVSGAFFDHCGESFAYLWSVQGDRLRLSTTAEEPCRFRRILFTGGPWTRISPGP
jgi:hypothetical protein